MKVAINTRFLLKDKLEGFGWYTFEICKRLVTEHPDVTFYFFFDRPYDKKYIFAKNVVPIILPPPARHPILFKIWFDYSVYFALKKNKIDVFFSPDGYLSLTTKVPQVNTIHDLNFEHYPLDLPKSASTYLRKYFSRFAKKANKIITISEFSKLDIVNSYKVDADKISVIYNGVASEYAVQSEEVKTITRNSFSKGKEYFLFVGSLHPRKNLKRLIEAFKMYVADGGSLDLVISGCSMWKGYEDFSIDSLIKQRIHFTGYISQENLINVMGSAKIFVYVSYYEGFGLPIVEAMKSGVPIISGDLTALPEVGGNAALYCDPFDVSDIFEKMKYLDKDQNLQEELIKKGFIQAQKFSWDRAAEEIWKEINEINERSMAKS